MFFRMVKPFGRENIILEVELPDGEYLVRAIVAPCGKEIGEICQDEKVVIYGSIYDDLYTRPAKKQEW